MGRLDHVHIRVPDRAEAARWYAEHLGFEPVDAYDFWATGFEGGPLQISAEAAGRCWRCSRPVRVTRSDLVDFDMCWAFDLVDPWGNQYELNCYDYDRVRAELVEADEVEVVRYWPRELFVAYLDDLASLPGPARSGVDVPNEGRRADTSEDRGEPKPDRRDADHFALDPDATSGLRVPV